MLPHTAFLQQQDNNALTSFQCLSFSKNQEERDGRVQQRLKQTEQTKATPALTSIWQQLDTEENVAKSGRKRLQHSSLNTLAHHMIQPGDSCYRESSWDML